MTRVIQPTEVINPNGSKVCMTSALTSKEETTDDNAYWQAIREFIEGSPEKFIVKMVSEQRGIF